MESSVGEIAGPTRRTSLRRLRTFCVAARHSSFRAAAEELFITASAVSHQIKGLEDELGRPLFDRGGRTLALTDDGRSLFDSIEPLISKLDQITATYRGEVRRRSLRVSVQPFFASELFIPQLPDFTSRYPDVDIRVATSDESSEHHPADTDVSIRVFRSPPPNLDSTLLFPLRLLPAGSPEFVDSLKVRGKRIVSDMTVIVHDSRPGAWSQWSRSSGIELPVNCPIIQLDSMISVARAAERGAGAALVPMPLSHAWFESGSLVPLFDHQLEISDGYYIVTRKDVADVDVVRKFRDWALQTFDERC